MVRQNPADTIRSPRRSRPQIRIRRQTTQPAPERSTDEHSTVPEPIPRSRRHKPTDHSGTAHIPKARTQPRSTPTDTGKSSARSYKETNRVRLPESRRRRSPECCARFRTRRDHRSRQRRAKHNGPIRSDRSGCRDCLPIDRRRQGWAPHASRLSSTSHC
jgi:hypothetical protein